MCRLKSIDFGLCVGMSFNMFVIVEKNRREKCPYVREMKYDSWKGKEHETFA